MTNSSGLGRWMRQNVLGLVAIYIALGGTALGLAGRNSVDSGDIENKQVKAKDLAKNSVRSATVRNDVLGGIDIDESSLALDPVAFGAPLAGDRITGQVSAAASADTATTATTATTVNGIERRYFNASQPSGAGAATVLDRGGMVVTMNCDPAASSNLEVQPNAPSSRRMHVFAEVPVNVGGAATDWRHREGPSLSGGPPASAIGRGVVFRAGGGMTTFDYTYYEIANGFATSDDCFLRGILEQAG